MSTHMHSALHHRLTLPSWIVAAFLVAAFALAALAIFNGSSATSSAAPSAAEMPTSCVDNTVVGHC